MPSPVFNGIICGTLCRRIHFEVTATGVSTRRQPKQLNGGTAMGEKGKKDKGGKEKKKEAKHSLKEKRQIKKENARNKSHGE
jgi:hypothetical protein